MMIRTVERGGPLRVRSDTLAEREPSPRSGCAIRASAWWGQAKNTLTAPPEERSVSPGSNTSCSTTAAPRDGVASAPPPDHPRRRTADIPRCGRRLDARTVASPSAAGRGRMRVHDALAPPSSQVKTMVAASSGRPGPGSTDRPRSGARSSGAADRATRRHATREPRGRARCRGRDDSQLREARRVVVAQEPARRDEQRHLGVRERMADLARPVERVQRDEHPAAPPHAERDGQPLGPVGQEQRDVRPSAHAASRQGAGDTIGEGRQIGEREPAARRDQRLGATVTRGERIQQGGKRPRAGIGRRAHAIPLRARPRDDIAPLCRTSREGSRVARADAAGVYAARCDPARRWRRAASRLPPAA